MKISVSSLNSLSGYIADCLLYKLLEKCMYLNRNYTSENLKFSTLFFAIVSSLCCYIQTNSSNSQSYEVIKPAINNKLKHFIKVFKKQRQQLITLDYSIEYCDTENIENWYIIDINNDGKEEYIYTLFQGSCSYLSLFVFVLENNRIKMIKQPKNLAYSCDRPFYNPLTEMHELFIRAQNKVYFCNTNRDIILWQNNKLCKICNNFWIQQQRKLFNQLYNAQQYYKAYTLLNHFERGYKKQMERKVDLWIRNDIVLAAIKFGFYQEALTLIGLIKQDMQILGNTTKFFLKSVDHNELLCRTLQEEDMRLGSRGKYNYEWLLEYATNNKQQISVDPRMDSLLAATVPNISTDDIDFYQIKLRLFVSTTNVKIIDKRYVVSAGFWPHNAGARGFLWCDLYERISAVAFNSDFSDLNDPIQIICITSRSLHADELPAEFFFELKLWLKEQEFSSTKLLFHDRCGKVTELAI